MSKGSQYILTGVEDNNTLSPQDLAPSKRKISYKNQDRISYIFIKTICVLVIILLLILIFMLFKSALPAVKEFNLGFVVNDFWNPVEDQFGALPFVFGTLVTSFISILIAAPISVAVALFISEILTKRLGKILSLFIEMIAAIPSIIFGLWGIYYLGPFVKETLTPVLKETLGFLPFFQGPSFGIGILTASLILAVMIIPTITSITREIFKTIPPLQKEAALALGATRLEMIKLSLLKPSFSGIVGAIVLGLGRALGETMAVAMVIGNSPNITASIFSPAATMASVIANEYAEADSDLHLSSLCYIGVLLFFVTLIVNSIARIIVWQRKDNK